MLPRRFRNERISGKLTRNEFGVLVEIWIATNPVNGVFSADYGTLVADFGKRISPVSIRKIFSALRSKRYIYFQNHRGRTGSFLVYPVNYALTSKTVQTWKYLTDKLSITTQSQLKPDPACDVEHNITDANHNLKQEREALNERFSLNNTARKITTANTETDTRIGIDKEKREDTPSEQDDNERPKWRR